MPPAKKKTAKKAVRKKAPAKKVAARKSPRKATPAKRTAKKTAPSKARPKTTASKRKKGGVIATLVVLGLIAALTLGGGASKDLRTPDFSSENPAVGMEDNTNPVLDSVEDWPDLIRAVEGHEEWYKQCLESRIGVTWDVAKQHAKLVSRKKNPLDLRFILISNSSISDQQARQQLHDQGVPNVDDLPIKRVNGFENTRGLPTDRCNAFGDDRNQVRVSLAVLKDVNDPKQGIHDDRGVLANCSNPWKLGAPPEGPPPSGPPPETPPCVVDCQPPPEEGKCDNQTGEFCGTPDSGPEYLPPTNPPTNPDADVSYQPPPSNPPPQGAPPQQPGDGGVPIDDGAGPGTPPTTSPPTGDPGSW